LNTLELLNRGEKSAAQIKLKLGESNVSGSDGRLIGGFSVGSITQTDYGYTGQRKEGYTGLMDYKARFYDGSLGRFLQPDSIVPGVGNPQNFNRFSYVGNSPIDQNDPTGHCARAKYKTQIITDDECEAGQEFGYLTYEANKEKRKRLQSDLIGSRSNVDFCHGKNNCYEPWEPPSDWDLNPKHADYSTFTVNGEILTFVATRDRYGQLYVGGGINFGKSILLPTFSFTNGWIDSAFDEEMPSQGNMGDFLGGFTVNIGGGYLGGGSMTVSPSTVEYIPALYTFNRRNPEVAPISWESGIYAPPGAGISVTNTFSLTPAINRVRTWLQLGQ
jgi:RHS repeat-associated protein